MKREKAIEEKERPGRVGDQLPIIQEEKEGGIEIFPGDNEEEEIREQNRTTINKKRMNPPN